MSSNYGKKSNPYTENGRMIGRSLHPWHFDKQDVMRSTGSRSDGIPYEEELRMRQKCCKFLYDMVNNLTHSKGDHLATGVAAVMINRFFKFHSFKTFDYRDIAAACLFLAGKNEDSPRKLKYVVTCWWNMKFPHTKTFTSEAQFLDACELITQLENIVLITIAFDMNVDLPHQHILKIMHQIERSGKYKEIVKSAYYMATEVLMITDWSIRYPCTFIAAACVNIAAYFQDIEIDKIAPIDIQSRWYRLEDENMKPSDLREMTNEFLEIFRNPSIRYGSLRRLDPTGKVKPLDRSPNPSDASPSQSLAHCPAPPPAPVLNPKKIDMVDYKERNRNNSGGASSSSTSTTTKRPSFVPDTNKAVMDKKPKMNEPFHTKERKSQSPSSSLNHHRSHHHHYHDGQGDIERHRHHSNGHDDHHKHNTNHQSSSSSSHPSASSHHRHSSSSSNGHGSHHGHGTYANHHHHHDSHNHHEKRAQLGYSNEFEPNGKRHKSEHYSMKQQYESSSSSTHHKSQTNNSTTNGATMSAYAAAANSLKHGKSSHISSKPQSTYQQMVAEMTKSKSAITSSSDPSPATISSSFSKSAALAPSTSRLQSMVNDEMEDGELR